MTFKSILNYSESETELVLFHGTSVPGKILKEGLGLKEYDVWTSRHHIAEKYGYVIKIAIPLDVAMNLWENNHISHIIDGIGDDVILFHNYKIPPKYLSCKKLEEEKKKEEEEFQEMVERWWAEEEALLEYLEEDY